MSKIKPMSFTFVARPPRGLRAVLLAGSRMYWREYMRLAMESALFEYRLAKVVKRKDPQ